MAAVAAGAARLEFGPAGTVALVLVGAPEEIGCGAPRPPRAAAAASVEAGEAADGADGAGDGVLLIRN